MRLLILLLSIAALSAVAAAQPVDERRLAQLAQELLDAGADGAALAELATPPPQADLEERLGSARAAALREAWQQAFATERVRADIASHIARHHALREIRAALEWLRDPAVTRATHPMRAATGRDFERAFGQWIATIQQDRLDAERLRRVTLISERSGEARIGEIVTALAEASIRGAHAAAPPRNRPPLEKTLAEFRALAPTLSMQAVIQNQLFLYYVLRDLSLGELDAYAAALDTPPGQWYVRVMAEAMRQAIAEATERLVSEARQADRRR